MFVFRHEYGEAEVTLELVSSMDEAIDHLHANGSGHTECIVTGEYGSLNTYSNTYLHMCCCVMHLLSCQVLCNRLIWFE